MRPERPARSEYQQQITSAYLSRHRVARTKQRGGSGNQQRPRPAGGACSGRFVITHGRVAILVDVNRAGNGRDGSLGRNLAGHLAYAAGVARDDRVDARDRVVVLIDLRPHRVGPVVDPGDQRCPIGCRGRMVGQVDAGERRDMRVQAATSIDYIKWLSR